MPTSTAVSPPRPSLGGHETFAFRSGWLKKGYDCLLKDGLIFGKERAIVDLGVGKNMVRSIRHWCLAAGLATEGPTEGSSRSKPLVATTFAHQLLSDDGWDPFFEYEATSWLIHWKIVSNPSRSTVWKLVFTAFNEQFFDKQALSGFLARHFQSHAWDGALETLSRDVDCLIRCYVPARLGSEAGDETFDCPLADLQLIRQAVLPGTYRFDTGSKLNLPPAVIAYAVADYIACAGNGEVTVSLADLLYGADSPGAAFKLDSASLIEYLDELDELTAGQLTFSEQAGLKQVLVRKQIEPEAILGCYYSRRRAS